MKLSSTVLFIFILSITSCNKEVVPTLTDYLTDGEWKYIPMGYDSDKNGKAESSSIAQCLLDNEIEFYKDGTGIEDENVVSCPITDQRYSDMEWSFSGDQSKILIKGDTTLNIIGEFHVVLLNNTHMSLRTDYFDPNTQQSVWIIYNFVQD